MVARRCFFLLSASVLSFTFAALAQARFDQATAEREERHTAPEWLAMKSHLPDPATGTPASLETAADVLRARRMPEDALDFYRYALARGGDPERLTTRIGITELELHHYLAARQCFQRAIQLHPKNGESWNNLGAAEFMGGAYGASIRDYQKAIKMNKKAAVFHANLGTAYFQTKDYESAGAQFERALALDPKIFEHSGYGGLQAHVMSSADRGKFCFEMARLAARHHDDESVLKWLAQASEAGLDVRYEMSSDASFSSYRNDERVALLIRNAKAMRSGQLAISGPAPALPAETPKLN